MSNDKTTKLIAKRIKRARQEIGMSQKELGSALKLSDKAISSYEVGRAQPSLETLLDLSRVTHKKVGYFFDASPEDDIDLRIKLKNIEKDLLEIKKMLQNG